MTTDTPSDAVPRSVWRRVLTWVLVVALVLLLIFGAASWYFSGLIINGMDIDDSPEEFPEVVLSADSGSIELDMTDPPAEDPNSGAITGIRLPGSDYLQSGPVEESEGTVATREVTTVFGDLPEDGTGAGIDGYYFPEDPEVGLGLEFTEVDIQTDLGPAPAWFVPGTEDTWVIFSHGRGASPREGLRMLQTSAELGLPTLLVTFRDDEQAPSEDGISNFGMTEWADLEDAVQYALDNGAEDIVLLAASTGAAISLSFLENSDLAQSVVSMVFDAPLVSFGQTVDLKAEEQSLPVVGWPIPGALLSSAKWVTQMRVDIDFEATDYVSRVDDLDVPTLIMHGTEDATNPIEGSEEFVENAPAGIATLEVFEGAGHVWSWNVDSTRYEALVAEHLQQAVS